ncbi:hypothetical protein, partial [Escherichia coli]
MCKEWFHPAFSNQCFPSFSFSPLF